MQRRVERLRTQTNSPRSKANQLIKEMNLSKQQMLRVRKHLILGNAIIDGVRAAHQENKGKRKRDVQTLSSIRSGKSVRKYRAKKWPSFETGIGRRNLTGLQRSKFGSKRVHRRKRARQVYPKEVEEFLERHDNSRCMPGKGDAKKSDSVKNQTRILTDYMANLHN